MADQDLELRRAGDGGRTGRGRFFFFFACLAGFSSLCEFFGFTQNKGGGGLRSATEDCDDDMPALRRKCTRESSGSDDGPEDTEEPDRVDSSKQLHNKDKTSLSFQENNSHLSVCADGQTRQQIQEG